MSVAVPPHRGARTSGRGASTGDRRPARARRARSARSADEAAERGAGRFAVVAQASRGAVLADRPRPESETRAAPAPGARTGPAPRTRSRSPCARCPRPRGREGERDGHDRDRKPERHRRDEPAARARDRLALRICRPHDLPRALAGLVLSGDFDAVEPHRSSSSSAARRSSPRLRRELTVPRGRSSSSAISPGVYSRRWRRTITARWSGGSSASARAGPRLAVRLLGRRHVGGELGLRAEPARAGPVDRAVDDDPVQPRPEGAPPVEAIERADRRQECLLRDVFGGCGVVRDEIGRPIGPRPVGAEERLDVLHRAVLGAPHPGALAAPAWHRSPTIRARSVSRSMRLRRPSRSMRRGTSAPLGAGAGAARPPARCRACPARARA